MSMCLASRGCWASAPFSCTDRSSRDSYAGGAERVIKSVAVTTAVTASPR